MNTNQNLKRKSRNGFTNGYLVNQNPQTAQQLSHMNLFVSLLQAYKSRLGCQSRKSESSSIDQPSKLSLV